MVVNLASRIIVAFKDGESDPSGSALVKTIKNFLGIKTKNIRTRRAYIIDSSLSHGELESLEKNLFVDPVTEHSVREMDNGFDWLVEVCYKPGVTNPISKTATKAANELLKVKLDGDSSISTAIQYLISGVNKQEAERIAKELLANPVIESTRILGSEEVQAKGIPILQYQIKDTEKDITKPCNLEVSDSNSWK